MGIYSEAFYKHWILFPTVWHLPRLSRGRTQGKAKYGEKNAHSLTRSEECWKPVTRHRYIAIFQKWLKRWVAYVLRGIWPALNSLSIHVKSTAIVPGAYPGEAKMCLRLSWRSQMPYPQIGCRQRHTGVTIVRYRQIMCALGWLQKLTHVPLAIAILLVRNFCDMIYNS